ncbi:MAG: Hsp70 family protein, partial [Candidatus Eremiobacterota bacterium]
PVTPPRPVIGIDFGTSSSKVSAIGRDDIELIKIRGQDTFPSLIYVNERGRVVIGYDASGEAEKEGFIKSIKSILRSGETDIKIHGINRPVAGLVSEFLQRFFQYIIREEAVEKLYGRNLTPHDVELVVTIPVKAKEKHEKTMGEILSKIGFRNVKFLAESTAASQFYLQSDKELSDGKVIVVFYCGAGTTDISILRINLCREDDGSYNRDFTLLAEDGIEKGGDHIDNALYDLVKHKLPDAAREILKEKEKDVTGKRLNLLLQEMERIKKAFSSDKSHQTLNVPGLISELKITYDEFEHTIKPLVDEVIDVLYRALDMADVHYMEVNMVYLVGGTTYIPVVQKELERIFTGRYISGHNDRLTCVAKGASMVKLGKTRRVLPFCYGYSVDTNPHVEVLLERGMIYPKENHRTISLLTVEENHIYTDIYIYKGETREELYEGKGTVVGRIICNIEQIGQVRSLEVHIEVDERGDVSSYVLYDPQGLNLRFDETGL